MTIRATVARLAHWRGRHRAQTPSPAMAAVLAAQPEWAQPIVFRSPAWTMPAHDPALGPMSPPEALVDPAAEVDDPRPYVGRRRSPGVVLGFADGTECELAAAAPAAKALRDLATTLTSRT